MPGTVGDAGVCKALLSKNAWPIWGHRTNRWETISEQWSLEKYTEVTIKAAAVQEKERLIFQQTCPWWRRRRKTRALKDGRGLQRWGDGMSKAEASGLGKRDQERAQGQGEKRAY